MDGGRLPALMLATACACFFAFSTACDPDAGPELVDAEVAKQLTAMKKKGKRGRIEIFTFSSMQDTIAITSAPGALLAPFPEGIPTFDEPAISNGALVAVKVHDEDDKLVGFGTEQEVLDIPNASALTTYTLTIPKRGTLMLRQTEDFSRFFAEIDHMRASGDLIRDFEPPLVETTTKRGTGRIIGGTGNYARARGFMREINIVRQINLVDRTVDLTVVLVVKLLGPGQAGTGEGGWSRARVP